MGIARLASDLRKLPIAQEVADRVSEFRLLGKKGSQAWFSELSFCVLTANATAQKGIELQEKIGHGFLTLVETQLQAKLKCHGYRFHTRAGFIVYNRRFSNLKDIILRFRTSAEAREWLAKNVMGVGYKEASHFLRNVGFMDVAILDRHILNVMKEYGVIMEIPKALTPKKYLEIEKALLPLSRTTKLSLGELDLYLWYMKTSKVLK
ncbi:MAG: N-glycosylase/DNA lyase [archaeon]